MHCKCNIEGLDTHTPHVHSLHLLPRFNLLDKHVACLTTTNVYPLLPYLSHICIYSPTQPTWPDPGLRDPSGLGLRSGVGSSRVREGVGSSQEFRKVGQEFRKIGKSGSRAGSGEAMVGFRLQRSGQGVGCPFVQMSDKSKSGLLCTMVWNESSIQCATTINKLFDTLSVTAC